MCLLHAPRHVWQAKPFVEFPARLAGLGDLQQHIPHAPLVTQAHRGLGHALAVQVLAKSARGIQHGVGTQFGTPSGIVLLGIVVYGLFHTAMQSKVALRVTLQTQRSGTHAALHGRLVNTAEAAPGKRHGSTGTHHQQSGRRCDSIAHGQRPRLRLSSLSNNVTWLEACR